MQVTKGTWRMREQCVPGSLSSSPAREPGNEASLASIAALLLSVYTTTNCDNFPTIKVTISFKA